MILLATRYDTEKNGISLRSDGVISGYTLDGTEKTIRLVISDSAGYVATGTMTFDSNDNG